VSQVTSEIKKEKPSKSSVSVPRLLSLYDYAYLPYEPLAIDCRAVSGGDNHCNTIPLRMPISASTRVADWYS
jgi:hypothetical protein